MERSMMTQDIQELLEGMLNDEQTAEVLHRLSVSPEKLTAFRQHMALQGAMDRDSRVNDLTDDEDDAVWAGILGATGGVVTGGAAAGSGGWLAKGAAFLLTGLAGFFIGTAVDSDSTAVQDTQATDGPSVAQQIQSPPASNAASPLVRIDTVYKTVVEPKIVYRDREVKVYVPSQTSASSDRITDGERNGMPTDRVGQQGGSAKDKLASPVNSSAVGSNVVDNVAVIENTNQPLPYTISDAALSELGSLASGRTSTVSPTRNDDLTVAIDSNVNTDPAASRIPSDPNKELAERRDSDREPSIDLDDSPNEPTSALMRNGWEVSYNERIGRITPPPAGLNKVDPNFGGRGLDLSYRFLDGALGVGGRLMYGSFARVTLEESVWFDLGVADTILRPNLETVSGFGTEIFFNGRIPIFSDDLALGAEFGIGVSETHYKTGLDLSLMYLLTNRLGVQAGAGYSSYWYSTNNQRRDILGERANTGLTSEISDSYRGTMLEGRYGLFFKF